MMDAREADLEPGQKWTGWHRIEKDLWPAAGRGLHAAHARGAGDVRRRPDGRTPRPSTSGSQTLTYTVDQIANGSRGLLEEVATGKVTGEEEYWSHTDLWDFQANVDGARVGYEGVEPILEQKDPELADRARRPVRGPAGAARRAAGRRRLHVLRPADARPGQAALRRRQRALRAAVAAHRGGAVLSEHARDTSRDAHSSAAARPPPGWRARSWSAGPASARARPASRRPGPRRTRSAESTRPASSPRPRTGCTSRRSTSPPTTATGWSRCCSSGRTRPSG